MKTREFLVNPTAWFDFTGLIFTHHERYYLLIERDRHVYLDLYNKNWTYRKMTVEKGGNKKYEHRDITEAQAKALMPKKTFNTLRYNEFRLPTESDGVDSRLQVYSNELNHLMLLKVKFEDDKQSENFTEPSFCLCEVTNDPYFSQASLSSKDYIHIQKYINKHYKDKISPSDFFENN